MPQRWQQTRRATATRWTAALGAAGTLLILGAAPPAGVAAPAAATKCSTAGLHYSYASYGATFGTKVASLKARGVKCATARSIAGLVARELLHGAAVPKRIRGLAVSVKLPCSGCTPTYSGVATGPGKRVTFTIMGGA